VLVHQGAAADSLIMVESGRISVMGKTTDGEPVRLRGMLGCTVVGEIALYIGGERSATVVADTPVVVHELTQVALARMEREAPPLAIAFHRMMARIEAERLRFTSHDLQALSP
jgi:SulP family sulfate permease